MLEGLADMFETEIRTTCRLYVELAPLDPLIGIGLMCDDGISSFASYLLSASMLPADAAADFRFNPMEWEPCSEMRELTEVNLLLQQGRSEIDDSKFPQYARRVFNACIEALARLNLHDRSGSELFITMGGVDPTDLLEREEYRFVERVNHRATYEAWLRDYA